MQLQELRSNQQTNKTFPETQKHFLFYMAVG